MKRWNSYVDGWTMESIHGREIPLSKKNCQICPNKSRGANGFGLSSVPKFESNKEIEFESNCIGFGFTV